MTNILQNKLNFKNFILLFAVFALAVISFFGEWIDAKKISFVSYSYFLIALYTVRCYLFCLLTVGLIDFCKNKKHIAFASEVFIFFPVIVSSVLILCGLPFNTLMIYSRLITILQIVTVTVLFVKIISMLCTSSFQVQKNCGQQNFEKLSKREKEVAQLLLEGKKTDEIAQELFISTATVKSHIQHIFEKYQVRNRMEFAAKIHSDKSQ